MKKVTGTRVKRRLGVNMGRATIRLMEECERFRIVLSRESDGKIVERGIFGFGVSWENPGI